MYNPWVYGKQELPWEITVNLALEKRPRNACGEDFSDCFNPGLCSYHKQFRFGAAKK
jgi:hypothetical protein